jgi:hypothetical protein
MTPKVDTFEHDIVDEIKRREASLAEINAVTKAAGPAAEVTVVKKTPVITIVLVTLFSIALCGLGGVGYYYFNNTLLPPSSKSVDINPNDIPKVTANLTKLSPTLALQIGRFVTSVEKKDKGYVLTINDYSSVFAYMTRNENVYIGELASIFMTASSTGILPAASSTLIASTTIATTTALTSTTSVASTKLSTTTKTTSTKTVTAKAPSAKNTKTTTTIKTLGGATTTALLDISTTTLGITTNASDMILGMRVSDVTINNQNMRVFTSSKNTIVYAFVGNTKLLISNSTEGILALKSAILH